VLALGPYFGRDLLTLVLQMASVGLAWVEDPDIEAQGRLTAVEAFFATVAVAEADIGSRVAVAVAVVHVDLFVAVDILVDSAAAAAALEVDNCELLLLDVHTFRCWLNPLDYRLGHTLALDCYFVLSGRALYKCSRLEPETTRQHGCHFAKRGTNQSRTTLAQTGPSSWPFFLWILPTTRQITVEVRIGNRPSSVTT